MVTRGEERLATITAEDRTALTDSLKRLLADHASETDVRRTMETASGYDPALWRQLAEMGVVGLVIDEAFGGVGAGPVELERVMEEAGAALLCSPLVSSGVLAAGLLQALGDEDAKTRLLPGIADGARIATAALTGRKGGWTPETIEVDATPVGSGWTLSGVASFVTHGQIANVLLVAARMADGIAIFEVDPTAREVAIKALPTFDHTLRLAEISFDAAPAHRLKSDDAWAAVEQALDLARIALCGEEAGGARRALEMTVDYAKVRAQFGRLIGSFQAIKHMAADLLLESESAISAARHAARALADGAADAPAALALASFACADAFSTVTATAIQMHGGIAFTWAHPAHLYLRRARADAQLFGGSAFHRERYLQRLGA
jgi:alkylation response protein AidB-like acyl-CoA dehydrogenase